MFSGLYINLDRSPDRRRLVEKQLAHVGLADRYQRLPASDGALCEQRAPATAGELGCFLSHYRALEIAGKSSAPTHIMEDDIILSPRLPAVVHAAVAGRLLEQFDLIYLDAHLPLELSIWDHYRRNIRPGELTVLNLGGSTFGATASYLVSPQAAGHVREICAGEFDRAPHAIDGIICEQAKAGALRVGAIIPFATTMSLADAMRSTIQAPTRYDDLRLVLMLGRYSFFMDADMAGYGRQFIDHLRDRLAIAPEHELTGRIRQAVDFLSSSLAASP